MTQFSLLAGIQLVEKSITYTLYRQFVWIGLCLAYIAAILSGTGTLLALSAVGIEGSGIGTVGGVFGFIALSLALYTLRKTVFLPIRAGHLCAMLNNIKNIKQDEKKSVELSKKKAKARYKKPATLLKMEQNIRAVLVDLYRKNNGIERKGEENLWLTKIIDSTLSYFIGFLAEVILAYGFDKKELPFKRACRDGLILFAQNEQKYFRLALICWAFMLLTYLASACLLIYPVSWLTELLPVSVGIWNLIVAMILAWGIKATYLESTCVAALLLVFLDFAEKHPVDENIGTNLQSISKTYSHFFKIKEIKE